MIIFLIFLIFDIHVFGSQVKFLLLATRLFFCIGEITNVLSEDCSAKFHKFNQENLVMEHFLRKVSDLQPETL